MKKWSFQKVHNEKMHFQKVECLVKAVKKCFLKSDSLRDKLPKKTMYI